MTTQAFVTTNITTYTLPPLRWCSWCGHSTRYGVHKTNGDFDYESVDVPVKEIERYMKLADWQNHGRTVEQVRRNIALGYHSGARP